MSKYVSIITVTYINSSEAIASQALAENMMEKIALDNGCDRVRCYLSGEVTRLIVFEYNEEKIQKELILNSGKPSNIVEKILEGKMKKYFSEVTLLNQSYILDQDKTVRDIINQYSKYEYKLISFDVVNL